MVSRSTRLVVAFAAALVAWLVATPARASAPFCDPRGATMIAPAPVLQSRQTSLDAAAPAAEDPSCDVGVPAVRTWHTERAPSPERSHSSATSVAVPPAAHPRLESPHRVSRAPRESAGSDRVGEHARVDRPPRV
jgi:hypothetical protein